MKLEHKVVKVKCKVYPPCEYDMVIEYAVDDDGVRHKLNSNPCEQAGVCDECTACQEKAISLVTKQGGDSIDGII